MQFWLLLAGLAAAFRIALSPTPAGLQAVTIAPYILLIFAPLASMILALRWFADGGDQPQPALRLARIGQWRSIEQAEAFAIHFMARRDHGFRCCCHAGQRAGARTGISRAMPALSGAIPSWLTTLQLMMTLDVILLSSLYTIAFVAAFAARRPFAPCGRYLGARLCDAGRHRPG